MTYLLLLLPFLVPQDKRKIEPAVREVAPKGTEAPEFVCEGATDLPDGCEIDVRIYFGEKAETGLQLHRSVVPVKEGKFSTTFALFKQKNLKGAYTFGVTFDPNFQPSRFSTIPRIALEVPLRVGTEDDARNEKLAHGKTLFNEIKGLVAIRDEAADLRRGGKLGPEGWEAKIKEWHQRAHDINHRVNEKLEYRILFPMALEGFEWLTGTVMDIARCASRGKDSDVREGTERLKLEVEKHNETLTGQPRDPKGVREEIAKEAIFWLKEAVYSNDDKRILARKAFPQKLFDLSRPALKLPDELRQTLIEISGSANQLFEALDAKKDAEAKELHTKIDARLGEFLKALQNLK